MTLYIDWEMDERTKTTSSRSRLLAHSQSPTLRKKIRKDCIGERITHLGLLASLDLSDKE